MIPKAAAIIIYKILLNSLWGCSNGGRLGESGQNVLSKYDIILASLMPRSRFTIFISAALMLLLLLLSFSI